MQSKQTKFVRVLTAGEFQRQCFEGVLDFLKQLRIKASQKSEFKKREPTELLKYYTILELRDKCKQQIEELADSISSKVRMDCRLIFLQDWRLSMWNGAFTPV